MTDRKIQFLLFALMLCLGSHLFSQKQTDTLNMKYRVFKTHYYQGQKKIKAKEFKAILSSTEASRAIVDEVHSLSGLSMITTFLGSGLLGYNVYQLYRNPGMGSIPIGIGASIFSASIPLYIARKIKIKKAVRVYNATLRQTDGFGN